MAHCARPKRAKAPNRGIDLAGFLKSNPAFTRWAGGQTHHHLNARLGNGGKTFLFLCFSHLIRPDQPISVAVDLRSCASGSPACTAGCDRFCASLPVCRKVSVTVTRLSTPGTRPSQCRLRNFHRGSPRVLHAPRSRTHPRSSTLRIHRIGRARRVCLVDDLSSVQYVR